MVKWKLQVCQVGLQSARLFGPLTVKNLEDDVAGCTTLIEGELYFTTLVP